MKRIFVTESCGASGASLRAGEVAEVSDADARILIALGKARAYAEPALPAIDPEMVEARDPEPEHRDPAPKPKRAPKKGA